MVLCVYYVSLMGVEMYSKATLYNANIVTRVETRSGQSTYSGRIGYFFSRSALIILSNIAVTDYTSDSYIREYRFINAKSNSTS